MTIENESVGGEEADFLSMDDDAVMAMQPPAAAAAVEEAPPATPDPVEPVVPAEPATPADEALAEPVVPPADEVAPVPAVDTEVPPKEGDPTPPVEAPPAVDYEAAYKKIMAPFKANGREIQLQSPEEAIKLQQMGANYTKKMQALQPALRIVKMLENNQLMDEGQLSYLIDLHQKKPEAIQKLLADSKFDPLEADVEKAATYVPGDHRVGENEIQFQAMLDDVESTPTGPELIAEVARQWDADSRQALFREPRLLAEINNQKANGLYGRISAEIEHRRLLGDLQGVPFLAAYEAVGKDLQARGLLVPAGQVPSPQAPVVTRVVAPTPVVANSERARAALPTKATTASNQADFNPLAQSDEDFLKSMQGRL